MFLGFVGLESGLGTIQNTEIFFKPASSSNQPLALTSHRLVVLVVGLHDGRHQTFAAAEWKFQGKWKPNTTGV